MFFLFLGTVSTVFHKLEKIQIFGFVPCVMESSHLFASVLLVQKENKEPESSLLSKAFLPKPAISYYLLYCMRYGWRWQYLPCVRQNHRRHSRPAQRLHHIKVVLLRTHCRGHIITGNVDFLCSHWDRNSLFDLFCNRQYPVVKYCAHRRNSIATETGNQAIAAELRCGRCRIDRRHDADCNIYRTTLGQSLVKWRLRSPIEPSNFL